MTVSANVAEGVQTAQVQQDIARELAKMDLGAGVTCKLKGEDEERAKASAFLMTAFATAMFLIFAILLAQFNRLTSVGLVLTAVMLSTIGVLLGLVVMGQPFGVVMTGIGVIANAGVIVNNNIVLIDTYDRLRHDGIPAYEAVLQTCRERARPVALTAVTAILGVLPIAFGVNLDFLSREVVVGAPATQWWISLSTAIVFGLGFATILTLIVTPAALLVIAHLAERRKSVMKRLSGGFGRYRREPASSN
jgi:multidrug efflux pump